MASKIETGLDTLLANQRGYSTVVSGLALFPQTDDHMLRYLSVLCAISLLSERRLLARKCNVDCVKDERSREYIMNGRWEVK